MTNESAQFPRVHQRFAKEDRHAALGAMIFGTLALAYAAINHRLEDWPQFGTIGSVILGVLALALMGYGIRIGRKAGRFKGHPNLRFLSTAAQMTQLESELAQAPEAWGDFGFTPSFLLAPGFMPIPIADIVWTFRRTTKAAVSGIETKHEMQLFLSSGESVSFVDDVSAIEPSFDCLVERRPQIKVGYDAHFHEVWKADPKGTAARLAVSSTIQ